MNAVAIKAPGFGERRKSLLQDIAIVTGAEYVAKDLGMKVETTGVESLGIARKVGARLILDSASMHVIHPNETRQLVHCCFVAI